MNKNYVKQFRLDNGIKFNGAIELLYHKYANHTWLVNDAEIYSAIECDNNFKFLTYTDNLEVMNGLLNGTIEFEKVKKYKRVSLASAVILLNSSEKIFIKINDQYHIIKYIEVRKDQVEVGYNDIQDRFFGVSHRGNEKNNLAFYEEV